MSHLRNLGDSFSVPIGADKEGYLGRECPIPECLGYFKITPGTGVTGPAPCYCPYCGHCGDSNTFFTQDQIEYARSVVLQKVVDAVRQDLKALEFEIKPQGPFGIGISMKLQESAPRPLHQYREKELETEVVCDICSLRFAIYGVFGWCPDCGAHNSLQILAKNLELARKELALAQASDRDLSDHLIGDALENVVSAFDGFGREVCLCKASDVRFQNLVSARQRVQQVFGFDFADQLAADDWECVVRAFQKRHLLSHKMGVVDEEYVRKAKDPSAAVGRKVRVGAEEVVSAIRIVDALGKRLFLGVLPPNPNP